MLKTETRKFLLDFICIFCIIFSFWVVSALQSSMLIGGICFLILCVYPSKCKSLAKLVWSPVGQIYLLAFLLIFSFNLFVCIFHRTFDYSYFLSFAMGFLKICFVFFYVSLVDVRGKKIEYYENIFVYIFVVQTFIQLAAFINTPFANLILRFNHSQELYEGYGGGRGLALSGGCGWPLATVYCLSFLFYTKNFLLEKKISISTLFIGIMLLCGVFFSGRTAYLGILTSILLFFVYSKKIKAKASIVIKFIFYLAIALFLFVSFFFLFASDSVQYFIDRVLPWAFEFFYKKQSSGKLQTGSTNVLLRMWEERKAVTSSIMLFGEGYYTDPVYGCYWHRVDVGYLRNIFYWGIPGMIILYGANIFFQIPLYLRLQKNGRKFIFVLLLTLFLMELKAMTIGSSHLNLIMITLWLLLQEKILLENKCEIGFNSKTILES